MSVNIESASRLAAHVLERQVHFTTVLKALESICIPLFVQMSGLNLKLEEAPGPDISERSNQYPESKSDKDVKQFYLFGYPISHSASPAFHNAIFKQLGVHAVYTLQPTQEVNEQMINLCRAENFGGCSVTMPLKVKIIDHLDRLAPEARAIGAVNTIVPVKNPENGNVELVGTNTDWLGVRNTILHEVARQHHLGANIPATFEPGKAAGLVIGGGGMARAAVFALTSLNCNPIYLVNRDDDELKALIAQFPEALLEPMWNKDPTPIVHLSEGEMLPSLCVVVGCIPAIRPITLEEQATWKFACAMLGMPYYYSNSKAVNSHQSALGNAWSYFARNNANITYIPMPKRRIFLEMCYKPRVTPLMQFAAEVGQCTVISGIEAMLEQGFAQSRMWGAGSDEKEIGMGPTLCNDNPGFGHLTEKIEDHVRNVTRNLPDILPKDSN